MEGNRQTITPEVMRRELDKTLTVKQLISITGVHERTVRRWIESGNITSFMIGKERRFTAESVIEFLDEHRPDIYENFRLEFLADRDPEVRAAFVKHIRSGGVSE